MVNIRNLLEERENYPLHSAKSDYWIDDIVKNHLDEKTIEAVVLPAFLINKSVSSKSPKNLILDSFNLAAVYNIKSPYTNLAVPFIIICLTKDKPKFIRIACFKGDEFARRPAQDKKSNKFGLGKTFSDDYNKYLNRLQVWENLGKIPSSEEEVFEFMEIPVEEFKIEKPLPDFYTHEMRELNATLKSKDLKKLKDLAHVTIPAYSKENTDGLLFQFKNAEYPYNVESARFGRITNTQIHKSDILISKIGNVPKYYLFSNEPEKPLYASTNTFVVRIKPEKISPEYLFIYLRCETGQKVYNLENLVQSYCIIPHLKKSELEDFPVICPGKSEDYYKQYFELKYLHKSKLGDYNTFLGEAEVPYAPKSSEEVLRREIIEDLKFYKQDSIKNILKTDLKELNACYNAKAYKATLIMTGSILEAVLIDWISEIYGEDFFLPIRKDTKWTYIRSKLETYDDYVPTLKEYIVGIQKISVPDWMDKKTAKNFYTNADNIREKRNLVHAKLCLKDCENIDEDLCNRVIGYLKEILQIRFGVAF